MEDVLEFVGYFSAHAVWCVSDAETLVPMLAVQRSDGSMQMTRFEGGLLEDSVSQARAALETNMDGNILAALFYDAYVNLPQGKTDAVMVEAVEYASGQKAKIALPYRDASHPDGFAVFRPKFLVVPDPSRAQQLGEALFRGVAKHEKGAVVWSEHLDERR